MIMTNSGNAIWVTRLGECSGMTWERSTGKGLDGMGAAHECREKNAEYRAGFCMHVQVDSHLDPSTSPLWPITHGKFQCFIVNKI